MRRRGACGRPCSRPRIGLRPKAPKASARSLSATSTSAANGWRSHRMRQPRPRHQADAQAAVVRGRTPEKRSRAEPAVPSPASRWTQSTPPHGPRLSLTSCKWTGLPANMAKGRGRRILMASAHSSPLPSQAALQAAILWPCPPARQHPRPLARSHPSRTPLRQTPRRRRRLWTPLPPRLLRQTPRRRRGSACQRPRHSRARQSTVGGPPLGFCQTHMRSWRRSSDRLVAPAAHKCPFQSNGRVYVVSEAAALRQFLCFLLFGPAGGARCP